MPEYLLAALIAMPPVPTGSVLHGKQREETFFPFPYEGPIYTFDDSLWPGVRIPAAWAPAPDAVMDGLGIARAAKVPLLIALTHEPEWRFPGSDEPLSLMKVKDLKDSSATRPEFLGYDVLDLQTGISGLTNIGLTAMEAEAYRSSGVSVNSHGLLDTLSFASVVAGIASRLALEHAPFEPVGIAIIK